VRQNQATLVTAMMVAVFDLFDNPIAPPKATVAGRAGRARIDSGCRDALLFCGNDVMVIGAMPVIEEAGRAIRPQLVKGLKSRQPRPNLEE